MTAPERIWANCTTPDAQKKRGDWHEYPYGTEYVRADLAAVPAQVCPECSNTGLRDTGGVYPWGEGIFVACDHNEPQPAPRDEVIKGLMEALEWSVGHISNLPMDEAAQSEFIRHRAAIAAAKAVQHG